MKSEHIGNCDFSDERTDHTNFMSSALVSERD